MFGLVGLLQPAGVDLTRGIFGLTVGGAWPARCSPDRASHRPAAACVQSYIPNRRSLALPGTGIADRPPIAIDLRSSNYIFYNYSIL